MESALDMMGAAGLASHHHEGEAGAATDQQPEGEQPEEAASQGPDADGWETVSRKGRRGR